MSHSVRSATQLMTENLIVKHYAGSLAYGTNLPTSDVDFRGIFVADPINVRTPFFTVEQAKDTTEEDTVLFELGNFMKLALDCNPNVIETLWVAESDIVATTPAYQLLREHAPKLLSRRVGFSTCGYAMGQLKRIKGHNKWISQPQPVEPPYQKDFMVDFVTRQPVDLEPYFQDHTFVKGKSGVWYVIKKEGHNVYHTERGTLNVSDGYDLREVAPAAVLTLGMRSEEYTTALSKHQQYWTWKKERNATRSELEEQHGYDTKHAMHLMRLLRTGREVLETGVYNVKRPDAAELLAIRNGAWTYEHLIEQAESLQADIDVWMEKTDLPHKPDLHLAARLVLEAQDMMWSR